MKKSITSFLLILSSIIGIAQTGINTALPNPNTVLHISEKMSKGAKASPKKGIIIPRLTEGERDILTYENPLTKVIKLGDDDDGLFIYNVTTSSYNFWSAKDKKWKTLSGVFDESGDGSGDFGLATYDLTCSAIKVYGSYLLNKSVDNDKSAYVSIPLKVKSKGTYTVTISTDNNVGIGYVASGVFLDPGDYTIKVYAQGTPKTLGKQKLTIKINGSTIHDEATSGTLCQPEIEIFDPAVVTPPNPVINKPMRLLTLAEFKKGYDASGAIITFNRRGYFQTITPSYQTQMIDSENNFGNYDASIVKYSGWGEWYSFQDDYTKPNTDKILNLINGTDTASPVDIIILHHSFSKSFINDAIIAYLEKGGVVLMYSGRGSLPVLGPIMKSIFPASTLTLSGGQTGTNYTTTLTTFKVGESGYSFSNVIDPLLVGPFGDVRNTYWWPLILNGTQYHSDYFTGLPKDQIVTISSDDDRVLAFRHKTLNLFWMGSDYFLTEASYNFNADVKTQAALPRVNGAFTRYGSMFYLNTIAWALEVAEKKGINANPD